MNEQQKIQMWTALAAAFPYLKITSQQTIVYEDVLFRFTPNCLHGRIFYGPLNMHIGGRSPFYAITIPGAWWTDPELRFDDDIGRTIYATTEDKEAKTARFWAEVENCVTRIGEQAKNQIKACVKRGDLHDACRHVRMLTGVIVWKQPRLRAALIRSIPTPDEAIHNRYLARRRKLFLTGLKCRILNIAQICKNWSDVKEICRLTWQMSTLRRVVSCNERAS